MARLINRLIGSTPIVDWYANKNIKYKINFSELVTWGKIVYIINSK